MDIKLNVGCGPTEIDGYIGIDRKKGTEAFPLAYEDGTVSEVYASHVLEHFKSSDIPNVIADWHRVLKPGGVIRIGVPDFKYCAEAYLNGSETQFPIGDIVMGGQLDNDDLHRSIFDENGLRILLEAAGFIGIRRFKAIHNDTTRLDCSLNMEAIKPTVVGKRVGERAVLVHTMPRLNWTYNREQVFAVCARLGLQSWNTSGAYFDQGMEKALELGIETGKEYVITADYDSVFVAEDVERLVSLMDLNPQAGAIAAMQAKRGPDGTLLIGRKDPVLASEMAADLIAVDAAHFGLTVIRSETLKRMRKPWLHHIPAADGTWGEGRMDADIAFWKRLNEVSQTFVSPTVNIGHLQVMVSWVGMNTKICDQHLDEYKRLGKPKNVRG